MAIVAFSESDMALEINNAGLIRSSRSTAVSGSDAADTIINTGVIEAAAGSGVAVALYGGTDHVINRGLILGDVELSSTSSHRDLFDGRGGIVTGEVRAGRGHDTYIVDQADITLLEKADEGIDEVRALVSWTLGAHFETLTLLGSAAIDGTGTLGDNEITGNSGANTLSGLRGHDLIRGGGGDDRLIGHRGNDTLMGDDGDDFLAGRDGYNDLRGGDGDDVLKAGQHQDRLDGGSGADTLNGGPGGDTLTGGDGADVFEFTVMRHSLLSQSERDVILDFQDNVDRIDLSAFDLTFAKDGFTGTMPEVRYTNMGSDDIQVRVDLDADGINDMRIDILGVRGLTINDLIL
jgi:Ca2+-binding RTX toxin-like protein